LLLYIHIPFCDSKCYYCSFNSYTSLFKHSKDYFKALVIQLKYDLEVFNVNNLKTLYIGGGTPSSVSAKNYKEIFKILKNYKIDEITIEANPNSAKYDWLSEIYDYGVDRISFGVQSFDEKKLKFLGRAHTKKNAIEAIENAKKIGFNNINLDLIYDSAIDNINLIKNDLRIIKSLPINHISCYSLTIEDNSAFQNNYSKQKQDLKLTLYLFNSLKEVGFNQYEISNFAKKGYESSHNLGYWSYEEYLGIGSGAVGFCQNFRYYPNKNIVEYIKNPINYKKELLSKNDIKFEKIFLGLRSKIGIEKKILSKEELYKANILIKEKKLKFKENRFYNNDFLLADELALYLSN